MELISVVTSPDINVLLVLAHSQFVGDKMIMNSVLLILAKTHQLEEKYISTVCTTSLSRAEIIRNQRFLPFHFVLSSLSFPFLSPVLPSASDFRRR